MSLYRLFMSLAFIGLLVPVGTAWAGAGDRDNDPAVLLEKRECSLKHVYKDNRAQKCVVEVTDCNDGRQICQERGASPECLPSIKDKCMVEYLTDAIEGTLTIIADDQPVIRPKCAAQTIFLSVRPDDQLRVLTNTALVENEFSASAEQRPLEWRLLSDKTESIKFRYRRADSEFAKELIHLFKDTLGFDEMKLATAGAVPVIADMENLTIKSDHDNTDDPLASVVSIRVWIRFATPEVVPFLAEADNIPCPTVASPVPDLDCDGDVDELDLNIVLNNRNKSVSQSTCGITSCGTTCDLDRDEKITALDARKLILLCSRPRCATQ